MQALFRRIPIEALLVTGVVLLCMYPLVLMQCTLKWDAIDISLPWRYFVSDALKNGVLPLWNPFQFQGFAQGTEPQTWYPIALLLGLFRGYDLLSLNLEYVLHLLLASWGFVRLARYLGISYRSACVAALCFTLSGFFIGNAQHMGWIVAGAWIPHLLSSFGNFLKTRHWRDALLVALTTVMLLSGGYIAYTLVVAYIVGVWALWFFLQRVGVRSQFVCQLLLLTSLIVLGSGVVLMGLLDLSAHLSRAEGLERDALLVGSGRISHLITLLFPAASLHETASFWQADQSLINNYISIPGAALLLCSLNWIRKDRSNRLLWFLGVIALIVSWGQQLPVREWLNILPGFHLFRLPSLFRYFFILAACLLVAKTIDRIVDHRAHPQWIRALVVISILFFITGLAYAKAGFGFTSFGSAVLSQSMMGLVLLLTTYLVMVVSIDSRQRILLLGAVVFLDLFLFIRLNGPTSVFSNHAWSVLQEDIRSLPKGYPLPPLQDVLLSNPDRSLQTHALYRNTNTLYKRIGWDGYTPYQYADFLKFEDSELYEKSLRQGPVILSTLNAVAEGGDYFPAQPNRELTGRQVKVIDFSPNMIAIETQTEHPRLLIYNQNFHPAWKAFLNDTLTDIHKSDINLLGLHLPAGNHQVRFEFRPGALVNALYISSFSLVIILLVLLFTSKHRSMIVVGGGMWLIFCLWQSSRARSDSVEFNQSEQVIINEFHENVEGSFLARDRFLDQADLGRLAYYQYAHPTAHIKGAQFLPTEFKGGPVVDSVQRLGLCNFETISMYWSRSLEEVYLDEKLNAYQDCTDLEFSSTFERTLTSIEKNIDLNVAVDLRCGPLSSASIVLSITNEEGQAEWYSHSLRGSSTNAEEWKRQQYHQQVHPKGGSKLKVYLWNPRGEKIWIDNFVISENKKSK